VSHSTLKRSHTSLGVNQAMWPAIWFTLLMVSVWGFPYADALLRAIEPSANEVVYRRASLASLLVQHLLVVSVAALLTTVCGVLAAIMVTRTWGRNFLPLVAQVASLGQTFPPVAVLALAVPALGFGTLPIIVALVLYGTLPIVRNTLGGLQGVDKEIKSAAIAMGMTPWQVLRQVELPLAAPVILAGIRTSITINISTAAIGATVGARNLGDPIIAGIVNGNMAYIVQGALTIALLALTVDSLFERIQERLRLRLYTS